MVQPVGEEVGPGAELPLGVIGLHGPVGYGTSLKQAQALWSNGGRGVAITDPLPALGGRRRRKAPTGVVTDAIGGGLNADASKALQMLQGPLPKLTAKSLPPVLWLHQKHADEAVFGVVTDPGNTADRTTVEATNPEPLAVGMAVDGYVSLARREMFSAGPGGDVGEIALLQGPNPQKGWGHPAQLEP